MNYTEFVQAMSYIKKCRAEMVKNIKDKLTRMFFKRKAINNDMLKMATEFYNEVTV